MNTNSSSGKEIAILAGPGLAGALRLAGVRRARSIEPEAVSEDSVRSTLRKWIAGDEIGVIVISEELAALARDLIAPHRMGKRVFPIILEVPADAEKADSAGYYRKLSRDFLGMEIVLDDNRPAADGDAE